MIKESRRKILTGIVSNLNTEMLFPIASVLLVISIVSALQDFFVFFKGTLTIYNFLRHFLSKLIYFFYLIPLILIIRIYSNKMSLKKKINRWIMIHFATLIVSLFLHQFISFCTDTLLLGKFYKSSLYSVMFTNPSVWGDIIIYFTCLLGFMLLAYREKNQKNELLCSKIEMELVKTKLYELRSKIHPQFLFNTLNTISELIEANKNKDANKILSKLSDFLRTTVYDSEREVVTLDEELKFLYQYLEIEKISFKNELVIREKIDPPTKYSLVPNFLLQPIAEDILYSSAKIQNSQCELYFETHKISSNLLIIISYKLPVDELNTRAIMNNSVLSFTHEHLKQLYDDDYSLIVDSNSKNEFSIKIQIPFREMTSESEITYVMEESI